MNATDIIAYAWNADIYCPDCAPLGEGELSPEPDFCGAEVDTPQHCCVCHEFIDGYALTDEGRNYVVQRILDYVHTDEGKPPAEWLSMADISLDIYDALRSLPHLAIHWHGGQTSDLYKVLSTGLSNTLETVRGAITELQSAYDQFCERDVIDDDTQQQLDEVESALYDLRNF